MRNERLSKKKDISYVFQTGRIGKHHMLVMRAVDNHLPCSRACYVVAKRYVASAVERNRIRRRLKEIFRAYNPRLAGNTDFIIIFRDKTKDISLRSQAQLEQAFVRICCDLGLLPHAKSTKKVY